MPHQERIGLLSKSKNYKHRRSLSMPKLVSSSLRKIIESRLNGNKQRESIPVSKWSYSPDERSPDSPERLIVSPIHNDDVFGPNTEEKGGRFHEKLLRLELSDKKDMLLASNGDEAPIKLQAKAFEGHHPVVKHDQAGYTQSHCAQHSHGQRASALQGNQGNHVCTNTGTHAQRPGEVCKDNEILKANTTAHAGTKPERLPNCTEQNGTKNWRVSRSTFVAYGAMRGPQEKAPGLPRSKTMDMCDSTQRNRWMHEKHHDKNETMGSCRSLIEDLQPLMHKRSSSTGNQGQAEQKEVFLVPRPSYKHIEPPANFNPENHKEPLVKIPIGYINKLKRHARKDWKAETDDINASMKAGPGILPEEAAKKDWDDDFIISDHEGDPLDNRISPCTFRLWAEGCQRWDSGKPKKAQEAKTQHRNAYHSPNPHPTPNTLGTETKRCRDPIDDQESDTLSYSPLGSEKMRSMKAWQRDVSQYTFDIRELCENLTSDENGCESDASNTYSRGLSESYTNSEVWNALHAEDAPILAGVQPHLAESVLLQRHHALNHETLTVQHMVLEKAAAELRISYRRKQLANVSYSVEQILNQRENQWSDRRKSIYDNVAQYLRDSENNFCNKRQEAQLLKCEVDVLVEYEKHLEKRLREEALRVMDRGVTNMGDIDRMVWHLSGGGGVEKGRYMPWI